MTHPLDALDLARDLVSARLRLTALRPEDADEMQQVLDDGRLHEFIGGAPLELAELRDRYRRLAIGRSPDGSARWFNWIVRLADDGQAIGTVQATVTGGADEFGAEVAWVIGVPWQGQGYATEATIAMVSHLETHGIVAVTAHIHPDHQASANVARRAGFVPTPDRVQSETVWRRTIGE